MSRARARMVEQEGCLIPMVHQERVDRARDQALEPEELERLGLIYQALGDPSRLKLLMALLGGEMCVCDLTALLGRSQSAVSHQLRRLRDLALVASRREGQVLYYGLADDHVRQLIEVGLAHLRE